MKKDKKPKSEQYHELDDYPYFIDDSKMPSAEESAKYKFESEIDARLNKRLEAVCKEFFD